MKKRGGYEAKFRQIATLVITLLDFFQLFSRGIVFQFNSKGGLHETKDFVDIFSPANLYILF